MYKTVVYVLVNGVITHQKWQISKCDTTQPHLFFISAILDV